MGLRCLTWNEWRNKRPGKILLVLTCLKEGNEEKEEKGEIPPENGVDQEKRRKKEKEKKEKKGKRKMMMMQVQAVSNAGTGYMVISRLFTVSRWYSQNTVSATDGKRLFPTA